MSLRDIKTRIRSISNTRQITKAMEVVAATKMRRSQELAIATRPFAINALELLHNITNKEGIQFPELMREREVKRVGLIVLASDKGLAGSFNANTFRRAEIWLKEQTQNTPIDIVAIGKKAKEFFVRRSANVIKEYVSSSDYGSFDKIDEIAQFISNKFINHNWDRVVIIYTHFRTTLKQEVVLRQILPLTPEYIAELVRGITPEHGRFSVNNESTIPSSEYIFEPSAQDVLDELVPFLFRVTLYHAMLESNASEHSSRMLAMKKANDNASEIISDLTLQYNKSRQSSITQELIEITSGFST